MVWLVIAFAAQAAAEPDPPVSVARVRAQLSQPPALKIALPKLPSPTFRLEVRAHRYWTDEPLTWDFKTPPMSPLLPPTSFGQPTFFAPGSGSGVDLWSLIGVVRHAVEERAAHKEIQKALAEFCAVHECREP